MSLHRLSANSPQICSAWLITLITGRPLSYFRKLRFWTQIPWVSSPNIWLQDVEIMSISSPIILQLETNNNKPMIQKTREPQARFVFERQVLRKCCFHSVPMPILLLGPTNGTLFQYSPNSRFYCTKTKFTQESKKRVSSDRNKDPEEKEPIPDSLSMWMKLEKTFPQVFLIINTLIKGCKSFSMEAKVYFRVFKQVRNDPQCIKQLRREEIVIYGQFSKDLPLMGLVGVLAFAPMGVTLFPLMLIFPRHLLSHHFWTPNQKVKFDRMDMKSRLEYAESLKNLLLHKFSNSEENNLTQLLIKVKRGDNLSPDEIMSQRQVFEKNPLSIESICEHGNPHMELISKANGLGLGFGLFSTKQATLMRGAMLLHYSDLAMQREGILTMEGKDLSFACMRRGLHPEWLTRKEMTDYLTAWVKVSSCLGESSISLLLHLPLFLAHNCPANSRLLGSTDS